jgi:hypothetical protein
MHCNDTYSRWQRVNAGKGREAVAQRRVHLAHAHTCTYLYFYRRTRTFCLDSRSIWRFCPARQGGSGLVTAQG